MQTFDLSVYLTVLNTIAEWNSYLIKVIHAVKWQIIINRALNFYVACSCISGYSLKASLSALLSNVWDPFIVPPRICRKSRFLKAIQSATAQSATKVLH